MTKNLKSPLNLILGGSLLIFAIFLIWQYWGSYPTYGWSLITGNAFSESLSFIIGPFLVLFGLIYGLLLWQRKVLTLAKSLGLLWFSIVTLFFIIGVSQPVNIWGEASVMGAVFNMFGTVGGALLGAILFTLFLILVGQVIECWIPTENHKVSILARLGKWIHHDKGTDNVEMSYFLSFFLGFLVMSFLGFFVVKLGLFIWWLFGGLFVILVVFRLDQVKVILNKIFVHKFNVNHWELLVIAIVLTVSVLNFTQSFFPFSIGWDSHNHYLLTVNTLIESGALRTGIFPSFTEIILGIMGLFTGLSGVQFLIVFWGSFLPLTFYMVGRRFEISDKLNLGLSLALFLLPAIQFQFSKDLKMDAIYLQLLLVALVYINTKRGLLLLGFAPLMKLTALWFWPIAVMVTIYRLLLKNIRVGIISLAVLFLPFTIWAGSNLVRHGSIPKTIGQWQQVLLKGDSQSPEFKIPRIVSGTLNWVVSTEPISLPKNEEVQKKKKLKSTAFEEEVGRYSGFETNFFKKLWAIFTSPNIPEQSKQYVNIGFLWIWFLPLLALSFWYGWKLDRSKLVFTISALGFLLAWVLVAEGVGWYGLPFIILLFLLSGWFISNNKLINKFVQRIVLFVIMIAIIFGLWDRLSHVAKNPVFTSMSWSMNTLIENEERLQKVFYIEELQVADILNEDTSSNIIRIGTMTKFWVDDSDARMIEDAQLDQWSRLAQGRGHASMVQVLKDNDITYILIDRNTVSIETNRQGTLHAKFTNLQSFIESAPKESLVETVFYGKRIILLKVK